MSTSRDLEPPRAPESISGSQSWSACGAPFFFFSYVYLQKKPQLKNKTDRKEHKLALKDEDGKVGDGEEGPGQQVHPVL